MIAIMGKKVVGEWDFKANKGWVSLDELEDIAETL
jgi:hypothetical protein